MGQCTNEQCKIHLCAECIMESQKSVTNQVLCRVCRLNDARKNRKTAKWDIKTFKIGSILGIIGTILGVIGLVVGMLGFTMGILEGTQLLFYTVACIVMLFAPYVWGANLLGIRKGFIWGWRIIRNIKILPLTILAVIFFIAGCWLIIGICAMVGIFLTPLILRNARKTLRETAYIETLPESEFTYPPPPPPASSTKANFCPNCGAKNDNNTNYCKNCGKQL